MKKEAIGCGEFLLQQGELAQKGYILMKHLLRFDSKKYINYSLIS